MQNQNHLLQLALAIVVMSSSGVLGRAILLPPEVTIWTRCAIGATGLWVFCKIAGIPLFIGWGRQFHIALVSAILMGAHWITYFYALKFSNVAIGMLSLFSYPVITALLEPLILKTNFDKSSLLLAVLTFAGIFVLIPSFDFDNSLAIGVILGLVSSVLYSINNLMLKKNIKEHSGVTLMYYQLIIIGVILLPFALWQHQPLIQGVKAQWLPILLLGLVTTAIGHSLFVKSFRHFTITTVSIFSSLSPLFGITLGFIFLDELPNGRIFLGGTLILSTVLFEALRSRSRTKTV